MKKLCLFVLMGVIMISLISQASANPLTDAGSWIWNNLKGVWEHIFNDEVIESASIIPQIPTLNIPDKEKAEWNNMKINTKDGKLTIDKDGFITTILVTGEKSGLPSATSLSQTFSVYKSDDYSKYWDLSFDNALGKADILTLEIKSDDKVVREGNRIIIGDKNRRQIVLDFSDKYTNVKEKGYNLSFTKENLIKVTNLDARFRLDPVITYVPNSTGGLSKRGTQVSFTATALTPLSALEMKTLSKDSVSSSVTQSGQGGADCSAKTMVSSCDSLSGNEAACNNAMDSSLMACFAPIPEVCTEDVPCATSSAFDFIMNITEQEDSINNIALRITSIGQTSPGNVKKIYAYNYLSSAWEQFAQGNCYSGETSIKCNITGIITRPTRYVNSSGNLRLRLVGTEALDFTLYYATARVDYVDEPPVIYNIQVNKTPVYVNEKINISWMVSDDINPSTSWLAHNFLSAETLIETESLTTANNYYTFGKLAYQGEQIRFDNSVYLKGVCFNISRQSTYPTAKEIYFGVWSSSTSYPLSPLALTPSIPYTYFPTTNRYMWVCKNFTNPYLLTAGATYRIVPFSNSSTSTSAYRIRRNDNYYSNGYRINGNFYSVTQPNRISSLSITTGKDLTFKAFGYSTGSAGWHNETKYTITNNPDLVSQNITAPATAGDYQYKVCANDSARQQTCLTQILKVYSSLTDTTFPKAYLNSPPNGTSLNYYVDLYPDFTDNTGVLYGGLNYKNKTETAWHNITGCSLMSPPYHCVWNTDNLTETTYIIRPYACDLSKNCNFTTNRKTYIIDRSVPIDIQKWVIYPKAQTSVKSWDSVMFKVNVTDGEETSAGLKNVTLDLYEANLSKKKKMTLFAGQMTSGQESEWRMSPRINQSTGLHYVNFYVFDNSTPSNVLWDSFQLVIDNIKPQYTIESLTNITSPIYANSTNTFQVSASDNLNLSHYIFSSNFKGSWINVTRNFSSGGLSDWATNTTNITIAGSFKYFFILYDDAGNSNTTFSPLLTIYGSPTILTPNLIAPPDNINLTYSTISNVTMWYNYTSNTIFNATYCSLELDGIINQTITAPSVNIANKFMKNVTNGTHNWLVICNNSLNDEFTSDVWSFNMSYVAEGGDTIKPILNITYPLNATYSYRVNMTNYTYMELDCDSVWMHNITGINSTRQNCGVNFTGLISVEGSNKWTIWMNDSSGNKNSTTKWFIFSTIAPPPTIASLIKTLFPISPNKKYLSNESIPIVRIS